MRKVLFVDDDQNTTQKSKKMLNAMCPDWEIDTTASGVDALDLMTKSSFDVIVSDIRIQEMDGIELLSTVSKLYPETVRIIHSEFSDLRSTMIVHQFLMKPCCAETMKNTIVRTCKLQDLLRDKTLRSVVTGIKNLPSLPSIYNLIVEEMQSPEGSLKKVGHLISQDVSMSAKILQLVNSAFFALPRKITDPQQASVFVGIETLKSLILSIHVFSSLTKDAELCGFSPVKMWRHSLRTGRFAGDIARAEKADSRVVEEAMIAGMLHDIGKLILLKIPQKYKEVMELIEKTGCTDTEAEFSVIDASHSELGAYLLGLWGLPVNVVESVAFHHKPSKLIERMSMMTAEKTKEDSDSVKANEVNLNLQPIEKYSTSFTALTAVHVANAMTMQGNCSSDTTSFPYLDMQYLEALELTEKIPGWIELYGNTAQLSEIKFR